MSDPAVRSSLGSAPREPEPVRVEGGALRGRALLDQFWADLTFLHWRVDPARVAALLPAGTYPDTFDGSTWVGLIPFRMQRFSFGSGPPVPYVGRFAETNVRLYAVDDAGRRGVVFASLESERLLFVLGSRFALGLPYTWSRMRIETHDDTITYRTRRRWPAPRGARSLIRVRVGTEPVVPDPLADFLTARWALHTRAWGATRYLPNTHGRWPLLPAEVLDLDDELVAAAGLPGVTDRPPDSVLFSRGVRTRFGWPEPRPA